MSKASHFRYSSVIIFFLFFGLAYAEVPVDDAKAKAFASSTGYMTVEAHQKKVTELEDNITKSKSEVASLDGRIAQFQELLRLRLANPGSRSPVSLQEGIRFLEKEKEKIADKIKQDRTELARHQEAIKAKGFAKTDSVDIAGALWETENLLATSDQVQNFLNKSGVKINKLYTELDKRLVGMYAEHLNKELLARFTAEKLCDAAKACQSRTQAEISSLRGEFQSFSEFRNTQMTPPSGGAPAHSEGAF